MNTWNLKSVYVQPQYRGQGIGTTLLESTIERLEKILHAEVIELTVNTLQKSAIRIYTKCGFIIKQTMENQVSGDGRLYTKFIMYRNFCPLPINNPHTVGIFLA